MYVAWNKNQLFGIQIFLCPFHYWVAAQVTPVGVKAECLDFLYCQALCWRLPQTPCLCRRNGLVPSGLCGYTSLIGRESSQRESDSFLLSKCNFLSLTPSYFTAVLHLASEINSQPQRKTGLAEWKLGIILSHESHTCREPNKCQPMALSPKCVKEEMSIFICIKWIEGLLLFPLVGLEWCHWLQQEQDWAMWEKLALLTCPDCILCVAGQLRF